MDNVDLTSEDEIVQLFPEYAQEKHRLFKQTGKPQPKTVNIDLFDLKVPLQANEYLLKNAELTIEASKKAAVYGANGTGKTTLFRDMANKEIKGMPKHLHIYHMEELEHLDNDDTVFNTILNAHPFRRVLVPLEAKIDEAFAKDPESAVLKKMKALVVKEMKGINGYSAEDRIRNSLRVLGFDEQGELRKTNDLSGGLRMRVALAMAFFIDPELLLLDEPTNHLDFPSVLWLENKMRSYKGSFLVVTHDRELLENCCNSCICIEDKSLSYYNCTFTEFEKKKAASDKKKFDDIEKFLKKNKNVDFSTPLGKEKAQKQAWSEKYYQRQVQLQGKFQFPRPELVEGQTTLEDDVSLIDLKDVTFSYRPGETPFIFPEPVSFDVRTTTRCGVMGPNGAGKSTVLKLLTQKLTPTTGSVTASKFELAYFGQHSTAELTLELTPMEFMMEQFPEEKTSSLRSHLAKTGVANGRESTRMKSLNFSERSCVIFAKLTYICPHLLIMDEPTNFLDLDSVDSLISACNKYSGALLLVSHNRQFLKKCAKTYLSIVPGKFDFYDTLKEAENATYSFISEMENGGDIDLKSAITSYADTNKGHQKKDEAEDDTPKEKEAVKSAKTYVFGAKKEEGDKPVTKAWKAGAKVKAVYKGDKKWYKAEIVACCPVVGGKKSYKVQYSDFPKDPVATVPYKWIKEDKTLKKKQVVEEGGEAKSGRVGGD